MFKGQYGSLAAMQDHALRRVLYGGLEGAERDAALALLHDVCPPDPPESYDPRPWIAAQTWRTAQTGDHQYVVIRKSTDWRGQLVFIRWLRVHGYAERFKGRTYFARDLDGYHYWAMVEVDHTIANRRQAFGAASVLLRRQF